MKKIFAVLLLLNLLTGCGSKVKNYYTTRGGNNKTGNFDSKPIKNLKNNKWKFYANGSIITDIVSTNELVLFGSSNGLLYALDKETGKEKWNVNTNVEIMNNLKDTTVFNNLVLFGGSNKYFFALDVNTGDEEWRFKADSEIGSIPIVENNLVMFGTIKGNFYALDVKTGEEKWKFKADGGISYNPASQDNLVLFGDNNGISYALDINTGKEKWRFKVEKPYMGNTVNFVDVSPVISNGAVLFESLNLGFYSIDLITGKSNWKFETSDNFPVTTTPAVGKGVVLLVRNQRCYALDEKTGKEKWSYIDKSKAIIISPMIVGEDAVVVSEDVFNIINLETGELKDQIQVEEPIIKNPDVNDGKIFYSTMYNLVSVIEFK